MLPAWMMPEPAPLDSVAHYPPLGTVQVGDVSVPLRDGRAVRSKANEDAKIKIKAVPARPRSVAAAPRRPDPKRATAQRSAIVPEELEVEVVSDVETPVKKVEKQECTVEEMFPYLPIQSPTASGHCRGHHRKSSGGRRDGRGGARLGSRDRPL